MRFTFLFVVMSIVLLPLTVAAQTTDSASEEKQTAKEIFEEVGKRHGRAIEFEAQKMTLIDNKGNESVRQLKRYARAVGPGENRFLMVFHSPKDIRGASMSMIFQEAQTIGQAHRVVRQQAHQRQ